jgi:Tol biopolymer transport system component
MRPRPVNRSRLRWLAIAATMRAARDLWRVRSDGTGLERLTSLDTSDSRLRRPRYTPDGAWILFTIADGTGSRLWAIPADGGAAVDVLPDMSVLDYDVRAPDQRGE